MVSRIYCTVLKMHPDVCKKAAHRYANCIQLPTGHYCALQHFSGVQRSKPTRDSISPARNPLRCSKIAIATPLKWKVLLRFCTLGDSNSIAGHPLIAEHLLIRSATF
jgi:hypothetical protein